MRVLIRADASPQIGAGHVMRCLALADELAARGASVTFACAFITDGVAASVEAAGHRLVRIKAVPELGASVEEWESAILSLEAQRRDALRAVEALPKPDWIILDHYRLEAGWLEAAAPDVGRLVIDDLANRPLPCNILVDQTLGRLPTDYAALVPDRCRILTGARYAMLRPSFAAARQDTLRRRRTSRGVGRILVSLGATDPTGSTLRVVESLLAAGVTCPVDVALGSNATSLGPLREAHADHPSILIHVDSDAMAALTAEADVAVGAAGSSAWERCCLGLPTVMLRLANNQATIAQRLCEVGAAKFVASPHAVGEAVAALMRKHADVERMIAASAAITDGTGAKLVADAMLGVTAASAGFELRAGKLSDAEALWLWRNDPMVRSLSKNRAPIAWRDHMSWFSAILNDPAKRLYIADANRHPIAMVRFDCSGSEAVVSINVDPLSRGRGIGKRALISACTEFMSTSAVRRIVAEIEPSNSASVKIFKAAGFEAKPQEAGQFRTFVLESRF